jgi:hypothetical protein
LVDVAVLLSGYLIAVLVPRVSDGPDPTPVIVTKTTISSGLESSLVPAAGEIRATIKCEDVDPETGQDIGPIFLSDLKAEFLAELDWMRRSEAKRLATSTGWRYDEDC